MLPKTKALMEKHFGCAHWGKTEQFNAHSGRKTDLFGLFDAVALGPKGIIGVQVCRYGDFAEHRKKWESLADPLRAWLEAGGRAFIVSWSAPEDRKRNNSKWVPTLAAPKFGPNGLEWRTKEI